jgi:HK97 gp10 family phage protein
MAAAKRIGEEAVDYAESIAPVKTGLLREGIDYDARQTRSGFALVLLNPVRYAIFQELGTSSHKAQPSLRPAADAIFPKYGQYVREAMAKR